MSTVFGDEKNVDGVLHIGMGMQIKLHDLKTM